MKRIVLIVCLFAFNFLLSAVPLTLAADADAAGSRPNIVFAIADDWGWPHAGAYGDKVVRTPTFDRIARDGVLFSNAFVSSPSCSPSRGAIITGQHFWRLGAGANLWNVWPAGRFAEYPKLAKSVGPGSRWISWQGL